DGIRDLTVTGVQTCALPICGDRPAAAGGGGRVRPAAEAAGVTESAAHDLGVAGPGRQPGLLARTAPQAALAGRPLRLGRLRRRQIGRASCRERGSGWGDWGG